MSSSSSNNNRRQSEPKIKDSQGGFMNWRGSVKRWLFLLILIASFLAFASWGSAQPIGDTGDLVCTDLPDAQETLRRLTDYVLLLELDKVKTERIRNLEKEVDLGKREVELKDWIIEIKDMRIAAQDQAIKDLKDITDRALKLAEQGKPKTNWGLLGTVLLAVFTLGLVVGM